MLFALRQEVHYKARPHLHFPHRPLKVLPWHLSLISRKRLPLLPEAQPAGIGAGATGMGEPQTQTMCFCFDFDLKEPRSLHADFRLAPVRLQKRSSHRTALPWSSAFVSPAQMFADISAPPAFKDRFLFLYRQSVDRSRDITTAFMIK